MSIKGDYRVVEPSAIDPNPWNPNVQSDFMYEKEIKSIERFGFVDPITVRSGNQDGEFELLQIIDGEHRWKAAQECGLEELPVIDLGSLSDEDAQALTLLLNELHGEPDRIKLAGIVVSFDESYHDVLPYGQDEIIQFKECLEFDWTNLDPHDRKDSGDGRHPFTIRLLETERQIVDEALEGEIGQNPGLSKAEALVNICKATLEDV